MGLLALIVLVFVGMWFFAVTKIRQSKKAGNDNDLHNYSILASAIIVFFGLGFALFGKSTLTRVVVEMGSNMGENPLEMAKIINQLWLVPVLGFVFFALGALQLLMVFVGKSSKNQK